MRLYKFVSYKSLLRDKKKIEKNGLLIYNFIETNFRLPKKDEEEIKNTIYKDEPEGKMLIKTYFDEIKEQGVEEGLERGREEGIEKGLEVGREEGKTLAKISSFEDEIAYHQLELKNIASSLKSEDITQKYFDRTSKVINAKLTQAQKELSILKNQLKKLNSKKKK